MFLLNEPHPWVWSFHCVWLLQVAAFSGRVGGREQPSCKMHSSEGMIPSLPEQQFPPFSRVVFLQAEARAHLEELESEMKAEALQYKSAASCEWLRS